jgi:hypothetical protein
VELRSRISNEREDAVDTSLKSFAENRREADPALDAIPSRKVVALNKPVSRLWCCLVVEARVQ